MYTGGASLHYVALDFHELVNRFVNPGTRYCDAENRTPTMARYVTVAFAHSSRVFFSTIQIFFFFEIIQNFVNTENIGNKGDIYSAEIKEFQ